MPTFAPFLKFLSTIYAPKKKKKSAFVRNEAVWVGRIEEKKWGGGEGVTGIKC